MTPDEARAAALELANYLRGLSHSPGDAPWRGYLPASQGLVRSSWASVPASTQQAVPDRAPASTQQAVSGRAPASTQEAVPIRAPASNPSVTVSRPETATDPAAAAASKPAPAVSASAQPSSQGQLREQAKAWTPARKLEYLRTQVMGDCQRCALARGRRHIVFGEGSPDAKVMLVGEAPGAHEDRQGRPFVGAAGQRLNAWIEATQWTRDEVFIANVLKCRPPHNRDPAPAEIEACKGFLGAQIRAIAPQVLIALGRFAGAWLLGRPGMKLHQMRGGDHRYQDPKLQGPPIHVVVTYHPAYVLRREQDAPAGQPSQEEKKVLQDFARAQALVSGAG